MYFGLYSILQNTDVHHIGGSRLENICKPVSLAVEINRQYINKKKIQIKEI